MDVLEYLRPENQIAQWIVIASLALFAVWFAVQLLNLKRHIGYRRQIQRCDDLSELIERDTVAADAEPSTVLSHSEVDVFWTFQKARRLSDRSVITRHLRAIFEAGRNESQLNIRSLIKNTSDELLRSSALQRSLVSIFIILGLLGTLFGLADTLASLDTLVQGTTKLDSEVLGQSLQTLLGTLKSAFAPSIWGVSLTILGVLLLSLYLHLIALPLLSLLERQTLTVWVPLLMPTTSQKLLTKLQLTERQMQKSFEAARQVAQFANNIKEETGDFSKTLGTANATLQQMTLVSGNLENFSQNFIEGVRTFGPIQQDLRSLYQQVAHESEVFHQSVESSIVESREFRSGLKDQLDGQQQTMTQMLIGLKSYEQAYVVNREQIDEKLAELLVEAQRAFESLSKRNQELGAALDEELGKPLRESLGQNLNGIQTELQERLSEVRDSLQVQLGALAARMERLDQPLNEAARNFGDTFSNFNETTRGLLTKLQLEFATQNETTQKQLQRLESLSENVPRLLETVSDSSKDFSVTSSAFAAHGHQLSKDVALLSQNINALAEGVESLKDHVTLKKFVGNVDATEQRIGDLIRQQMGVLQQLNRSIEMLSTRRREPGFSSDGKTPPVVAAPDLRWRDKVKTFFGFDR
jgi:archaellum component FlaC